MLRFAPYTYTVRMERTGTRERLILAAETLFGQKGIDAVSLREINVAAGQRNTSASHYHFGSKEALVTAIFDLRQEALGRRRADMLDAMERGSFAAARQLEQRATPGAERVIVTAVRDLARVLVDPLAEMVSDEGGRSHYVSFLAQLFLQPTASWRGLIERPDGALPRLAQELVTLVPMPAPLAANRMMVMSQHVATSLASHHRWLQQWTDGGTPLRPLPLATFVLTLIDGVTAYLASPVSPELRQALEDESGS